MATNLRTEKLSCTIIFIISLKFYFFDKYNNDISVPFLLFAKSQQYVLLFCTFICAHRLIDELAIKRNPCIVVYKSVDKHTSAGHRWKRQNLMNGIRGKIQRRQHIRNPYNLPPSEHEGFHTPCGLVDFTCLRAVPFVHMKHMRLYIHVEYIIIILNVLMYPEGKTFTFRK